MDFQADEAIVRKEGDTLIVTPVRKRLLVELLEGWEPIDDPFPDVDEDLDSPDASARRRIGFMDGEIETPDDFDTLGTTGIERLFEGCD